LRLLKKKKGFAEIKGIAFRKDGKLNFTPKRELICDLDALPFPDRKKTIDYRKNYAMGQWKPAALIQSSRGCSYKCDFCALWQIFDGKYRIRSAAKFADELETISEYYIHFADDNTFQDIKYAENLYKEIKSRNIKKKYKLWGRADTVVKHPDIIEKWKEIGLEFLFIGLESIRNEYLQKNNKKISVEINEKAIKILREIGVEIKPSFIVEQDFTENDFRELSEFIKKNEIKIPYFTILTPMPGTNLFKRREKELVTRDYELFDFFHTVLPTKLPLEEFYQQYYNLYKLAYNFETCSRIFYFNTD